MATLLTDIGPPAAKRRKTLATAMIMEKKKATVPASTSPLLPPPPPPSLSSSLIAVLNLYAAVQTCTFQWAGYIIQSTLGDEEGWEEMAGEWDDKTDISVVFHNLLVKLHARRRWFEWSIDCQKVKYYIENREGVDAVAGQEALHYLTDKLATWSQVILRFEELGRQIVAEMIPRASTPTEQLHNVQVIQRFWKLCEMVALVNVRFHGFDLDFIEHCEKRSDLRDQLYDILVVERRKGNTKYQQIINRLENYEPQLAMFKDEWVEILPSPLNYALREKQRALATSGMLATTCNPSLRAQLISQNMWQFLLRNLHILEDAHSLSFCGLCPRCHYPYFKRSARYRTCISDTADDEFDGEDDECAGPGYCYACHNERESLVFPISVTTNVITGQIIPQFAPLTFITSGSTVGPMAASAAAAAAAATTILTGNIVVAPARRATVTATTTTSGGESDMDDSSNNEDEDDHNGDVLISAETNLPTTGAGSATLRARKFTGDIQALEQLVSREDLERLRKISNKGKSKKAADHDGGDDEEDRDDNGGGGGSKKTKKSKRTEAQKMRDFLDTFKFKIECWNCKKVDLPVRLFEQLDAYFQQQDVPDRYSAQCLPFTDGKRDGTTKTLMWQALSALKCASLFPHVSYICQEYWGWKTRPINKSLERKILNDCRLFREVWVKINHFLGRDSTLNNELVFYKILKKNGYKCTEDDFKLVTTDHIRQFHQVAWRIVEDILGWPHD